MTGHNAENHLTVCPIFWNLPFMKSLRKILFILFVSIAIAFGGQSIYSQINIQRVVINPLNRATFYCSELPQNYATKLSDDKQKVVIMLRDALVTDSSREKHGTGIISDVYVQSFKKNLEISVILKDKRGYTAAPLIYSRAVMVEVFRWDQLAPAEDEYRTGLLALEANIVSSAEKSFEKSVSLGNADASVFLGFLRLQQGRVKSALENLLISYKFQIKIPDAYAALSQIMKMNGYRSEAAILADTFYKQTGLVSFPEIVVPDNPELSDADKNFDSLLKEFSLLLTQDSSAILAKQDSVKKDSTDNKRFQKIFDSKDNSKKDAITQILESFIPEGFSKLLFVFIVLFVVIFILLIFAYFRWRKKQVEVRRKKPSGARKDYTTAKQPPAIARKAVSAYQKSGTLIDKKIGASEEITKVDKTIKTEEKKPSKFEQTFEEKLNDLAEKLEPAKKDILLADRGKLPDSSEDIKLTAKLELALHLLDEQQKLKEKDTGKSEDSEIQTDLSKLKEVAKSLGILKENNQAGEPKVDDSKEMISQLADKFAKEIAHED
ncbi:MAG: hypothetical protein A2475_04815 [Ignavibacteria bacterium RIFOXYC2_FULL_35_21]|nr:MAG: hypothetical protein A2X63_12485 [Ignavibacteria bacterium GWA2_35_8]OGU95005.1 MAG: hypothetical protein A2220_09565 [Ignavibacteria bacterium RIFOXYA2_FULL_35_10]OGV19392.1 MAG: hypothetical protein A2475_04815 [Ignavibacteria bacterium RIFOXYC2_FULL_35_21]